MSRISTDTPSECGFRSTKLKISTANEYAKYAYNDVDDDDDDGHSDDDDDDGDKRHILADRELNSRRAKLLRRVSIATAFSD